MRGRRHARRLQYIRNMPESERTPFMERVASGENSGDASSNSIFHAVLRLQRAHPVHAASPVHEGLFRLAHLHTCAVVGYSHTHTVRRPACA